MDGHELVERAASAIELAAAGDASAARRAVEALDLICAAPLGAGLKWGTIDLAQAIRSLMWHGLRSTAGVVYPALAKELRDMQATKRPVADLATTEVSK